MKPYDTYKDSGIEWIGGIPSHWEVKKIKHRCYVKARVGWKGLKSDEFLQEGYAYLVTGSDFKNDKVNWKECYHIDKERYDEDPYIQLQDEDLLITKDGTIGKLAIVNNLDKPACLNSGIFVVRSTKNDFSTEFLFWILKSTMFTQFNEYTSYGSTIQHLYQNVFVEFGFTFPSKEEQTAIATCLDRKTAEIDALIADKKNLLELYEEEKTAIINQAVTKGIDLKVKMKDSGIDWLGEIPEHWELKRSRYICKITTGSKDTENREDDGIYPFFVRSQTIERISTYSYDGEGILTAGDGVGVCKVWHYINGKFDFHQRVYLMYDFVNIQGEFLFYFMRQNFIHDVLKQSAKSTVDSLRRNMFLDFVVAFPEDTKEQQSIVRHIETECTIINAKIAKTQKLIELLTEYRTALISEVVTGKIKVMD